MRHFCIFVSIVTAVGLVGSIFVAFVGAYIAIWGDNAFGGRIVASAVVTVFFMIGMGLPAHEFIKKNGGY